MAGRTCPACAYGNWADDDEEGWRFCPRCGAELPPWPFNPERCDVVISDAGDGWPGPARMAHAKKCGADATLCGLDLTASYERHAMWGYYEGVRLDGAMWRDAICKTCRRVADLARRAREATT